jgi:hypothetical protein
VLEHGTTAEVSHGVLAWDGCYNRQSWESIRSRLWPYPTLATSYMNYGVCWTNSTVGISWASCWVTFIGYGGGENYCAGAPWTAGSWAAAEDDWYFYAYSLPWWHQNHGFRDTWRASPFGMSESSW